MFLERLVDHMRIMFLTIIVHRRVFSGVWLEEGGDITGTKWQLGSPRERNTPVLGR